MLFLFVYFFLFCQLFEDTLRQLKIYTIQNLSLWWKKIFDIYDKLNLTPRVFYDVWSDIKITGIPNWAAHWLPNPITKGKSAYLFIKILMLLKYYILKCIWKKKLFFFYQILVFKKTPNQHRKNALIKI